MANRDLPITMQRPPDFVHCHPNYGATIRGLNVVNCGQAVASLPTSSSIPVHYHLDGSTPPFIIPWQTRSGSCQVVLETGGPWVPGETISLSPGTVHSMASLVLSDCVQQQGIGGFATAGLRNMINHLADISTVWNTPYPDTSSYITVLMTSGMAQNPGDTDPTTSRQMAAYLGEMASSQPLGPLRDHYQNQQAHLLQSSLSMERGDTTDWWDLGPSLQDTMGYTCDAGFGSPRLLDCSQMAYSQLGYPSDRVDIFPWEPKLLSLNTCTVQIHSETALTLTWAQIKAALDALIEICLDDPTQAPKGGTAFWGHQELHDIGHRRRRGSTTANNVTDYTGLNALPQNVNITILESKIA